MKEAKPGPRPAASSVIQAQASGWLKPRAKPAPADGVGGGRYGPDSDQPQAAQAARRVAGQRENRKEGVGMVGYTRSRLAMDGKGAEQGEAF